MTRSRRTHLVAATVTIGATVLAGCADTTGTGQISSPQVVGADASTVSDAPTDTGGTGTPAPEGALASLKQAGETTSAFTSGRYSYSMSDADGTEAITVEGEFSGEQTRQTTTLAAGLGTDEPQSIESVTDSDGLYVRGELFGGDDWSKLEVPEGMGDVATGLGGLIGSHGYAAEVLDVVSGAYGEVTTVGTEDVRGVATTHYRVDVDLAQVAPEVAGEVTEAGTMPTDVWVDADGIVRRLSISSGTGQDGLLGGAVTVELWDLGADISIDVPTDAKPLDPLSLIGEGLFGN